MKNGNKMNKTRIMGLFMATVIIMASGLLVFAPRRTTSAIPSTPSSWDDLGPIGQWKLQELYVCMYWSHGTPVDCDLGPGWECMQFDTQRFGCIVFCRLIGPDGGYIDFAEKECYECSAAGPPI